MGTPVEPGNRGVMALAASLVDLCENAEPDAKIVFLLVHKPHPPVSLLTRNGERIIEVRNCRLNLSDGLKNCLFTNLALSFIHRCIPSTVLRRKIESATPWMKTLSECKWVGDVRGGDSFSDIYGMKRFIQAFLPIFSVLLVKRKIVHFPQTYGPFRKDRSRRIATYLLKRSSVAIARDRTSQSVAQNLVGDQFKIRISPDVAFALTSRIPKEIETLPPLSEVDQEYLFGINVNGLMYNGGYSNSKFELALDYKQFLINTVTRLMAIHPGKFLLIPHVYAVFGDIESDNECCEKLRNALSPEHQNRCIIVTKEYDQHEIKGIIGKCSFFMGSRMHSCIAALSQAVPCIGVAYSMKFKGVFDSVGASSWVIDGEKLKADRASDRVVELYEQRNSIAPILRTEVTEAQLRLNEVFAEIARAH